MASRSECRSLLSVTIISTMVTFLMGMQAWVFALPVAPPAASSKAVLRQPSRDATPASRARRPAKSQMLDL